MPLRISHLRSWALSYHPEDPAGRRGPLARPSGQGAGKQEYGTCGARRNVSRSRFCCRDVGRTLGSASRVSTFGFTVGPQLITALSEGRGYGEAGGEGLFSSCQISESLTHTFQVLIAVLKADDRSQR